MTDLSWLLEPSFCESFVGPHPRYGWGFPEEIPKKTGKTPETLSELFLEFPSRVRLGSPKPYNSRHLMPPEHFQNSLPLSTAGDASFFCRSGSGEAYQSWSWNPQQYWGYLWFVLSLTTQRAQGSKNFFLNWTHEKPFPHARKNILTWSFHSWFGNFILAWNVQSRALFFCGQGQARIEKTILDYKLHSVLKAWVFDIASRDWIFSILGPWGKLWTSTTSMLMLKSLQIWRIVLGVKN